MVRDQLGVIELSEEQVDLLNIAKAFCRDKSPMEKVRILIDDDLGYDTAIWQEIVELGWLGIAIDEVYGGIGLSLAEMVPVMEQMGRYMMASPYLATSLAAQLLLKGGDETKKSEILPKIIAGEPATLAISEIDMGWDETQIQTRAKRENGKLTLSGTKIHVMDLHCAKWLGIALKLDGQLGFVWIETTSIPSDHWRCETIIDETKRSFELKLDGLKLPESALMPMEIAGSTWSHLHICANLLISAEMCGASQSVIDYTVDYLKTRKQFGKPIGSYQSLKHTMVDAYVDYEKARSHLYSAAYSFRDQGQGEIAVRMAKTKAESALNFAADRAIQFHGGFGFTYECDAHLYRRNGIWNASQYGNAHFHKKKLAKLLLG